MQILRAFVSPFLIVTAVTLGGCEMIGDLGAGLTQAALDDGDYSLADAQPEFGTSSFKRIQTNLKKLGYDPGKPDGLIGPKSTAAIKAYQKTRGLEIDGKVSWTLIADLEAHLAIKENKDIAPGKPLLTPSDFPAYDASTTFVYSNGEVDRVLAVKGETVRWSRDDETSYTKHPNFLMPWSSWSSQTERGASSVKGQPRRLWPLAKGQSVSFKTTVIVQRTDEAEIPPDEWVERWRCENGGPATVSVMAGTFDTVVFKCSRAQNVQTPPVVRTWYYAPSIRHYVRFVEEFPTQHYETRADLVAVVPGAPNWPPIARAALERAVLHALTTSENDNPVSWTSSGVDTKVTIAASSTTVHNNGRSCRSFVQTWSEKGRARRFPAVACKTLRGIWQIPGFENETKNRLAISGGLS